MKMYKYLFLKNLQQSKKLSKCLSCLSHVAICVLNFNTAKSSGTNLYGYANIESY